MTLGSLFDGIGGFPLAASRYGITPVWASEIEPIPVSITKRHFPNMKHLGDITMVDGGKIEPVDIITFGSPCQDLSVAGKQTGLDGSRSSLFYEAVRIIKEMRKATNGNYPKYAVWENVPGAFSSHRGEDFRRVLSALTESEISIPKSGKWADSGVVRASDRAVAWRSLDARYWGVPQRRKRIYLVVSFGNTSAEEILFKPESLYGYTPQSGASREGVAATVDSGVESADFIGTASPTAGGIGYEKETAPALRASILPNCLQGVYEMSHPNEGLRECEDNIAPTLQARMGTGGNQIPLVVDVAYSIGNGQRDNTGLHDIAGALNCMHNPQSVVYTLDRAAFNQGENAKYDFEISDKGIVSTLVARGASAMCSFDDFIKRWIVRRFTPKECERLQGFPDDWTKYRDDGKEIKDTPRYKALGNSIAIPCAERVFRGIVSLEVKNDIS